MGTNSSTCSRDAGIRSFYVRALVTSNGVPVASNEFYVFVEYEPMCGGVCC